MRAIIVQYIVSIIIIDILNIHYSFKYYGCKTLILIMITVSSVRK